MDAWKFCCSLQQKWNSEFVNDELLADSMAKWRKMRSIRLVWLSDKFGGTLPEGANEYKTHQILSEMYEELFGTDIQVDNSPSTKHCNVEEDRYSEHQLKQHLKALLFLTKQSNKATPLSVEMIKSAHRILAKGLVSEDGSAINAGEYRRIPVHSCFHSYPGFECISVRMEEIVAKYNERSSEDHDLFQLASWLLCQVLTLHPFLDGNGRVSRLLWCYSLLRDDLPFPVTPFPGIKKAYRCIRNDQESELVNPSCKHLTSLTVISITQTWNNFLSNLKRQAPEKYEVIRDWLEKSKILFNYED